MNKPERDSADQEEVEAEKSGSAFWETVRTIVYAVLIALVVRTFAYEPFNIPSGSMKPTLLVGDYLFVSKYAYGYSRYSFPFNFPPFQGRVFGDKPEQGDVAVFKLPRDNKTDYIKRIIGMPGDKIQVVEGVLHINGQAVKREKVEIQLTKDYAGFPVTITQYIETLPNGRTHYIWEESDNERFDNTPIYEVPPGHYFAMGDNRDHSLDSRAREVSYVPYENLVGRAGVIFFSHNSSASLWEIWKWPQAIRFGRIGDVVE
ncbi:MAG: signal peptidase I [Pseudomonadota bacterium]